MRRRTSAWTALLLCSATGLATAGLAAQAQATATVTGRVVQARDLRPVEGAQVSVDGTPLGTLADRSGGFVIANVPPGEHVLVVTMIGYGSRRVPLSLEAGRTAVLELGLEEAPFALDELIVTGAAEGVRAKELGHAVDVITSREIERMALRGSEEILGGRSPGVTVSTNSGQPGAGGTVRIRGLTTVSQTVEPLLYVDRVRVYNLPTRTGWDSRTAVNPLQDVSPWDIERIEILKGPAATTLYGTEAAGGVIQIFTKTGIAGTPMWSAELAMGVNHQGSFLSDNAGDPNDLYTRCGNLDTLYSLNVLAETSDPDFGRRTWFYDPTCPADGNWQQNGLAKSGRLSVRGGLGDVTYYLGGHFSDQDGVLPTARSRDGGFRGNFAFAPLPDWGFSLGTSYTRRETRWVPDGNNADGFLLNVARGASNYLQGGKGEDCLESPAAPDGGGRVCVTNGYLFDSELLSEGDHFTTGLTTHWNPTEELSSRLAIGLDYTHIRGETVLPFGYIRVPNGLFWDETTRHTTISLDYTGSLRKGVGRELTSTLSWGWQVFKDRHRWTELDVEGFPGPGRPTLATGAELNFRGEYTVNESNAGLFLQEMVSWRDRLFVTVGLRADGHSSFGDDHGLQYYPKLSTSWVLSDEEFWPSEWFETFKLRAAVGFSGRAPGPFDRVRTWRAVSLEGEPGFTPDEVGNADIGPEKSREVELGIDASLLQGRLSAQATFYDARTSDALIARTLPPSLGFMTTRTENVGELSSGGWEFEVNGTPIRNPLMDLRLRLSVSLLHSQAVDLDGDPTVHTSLPADNLARIQEGAAVPVYVGERVANPDDDADPAVEQNAVIGPVFPTRLIGLGATLAIGRLRVDALAEHQGGHYLPNYTGYQTARRGAWFPCIGIQERIVAKFRGEADALDGVRALDRARCGFGNAVGYNSDPDYWVEKADFWKLRSLTVTYELPQSVRVGRRASLFVSARNLFVWTDYTGTDPEVMDFADLAETVYDGEGDYGRRDYYQIPNPRTFTLGARVSW